MFLVLFTKNQEKISTMKIGKVKYTPLSVQKETPKGTVFAVNEEKKLVCVRHPDGTISYHVKQKP